MRLTRCAVGLLAPLVLASGMGACSTLERLNPLAERDVILPGERRPVFAQGEGVTTWRQTPEGRAMAAGQTPPPGAGMGGLPTGGQQQGLEGMNQNPALMEP